MTYYEGDTSQPYVHFYHSEAQRLVDALMRYLPGGLVDALFAELAWRKASVLRVPHIQQEE